MLLIRLLKHLSDLFVGIGLFLLAGAIWYSIIEDDGVTVLFGTPTDTALTAIVVAGPFLLAWAFRWVIAPAKDTTQVAEAPEPKKESEGGTWGYAGAHWRGELSLARSYWVHVFLLWQNRQKMEPETDEESLDLLAEFELAFLFLLVFVGVLFGRLFL